MKVVASKNDQNSVEGYPMYFGDRHSLQVEGYTDGDQDDRYDRADSDRSDRNVLSLERLPLVSYKNNQNYSYYEIFNNKF